MLIFIRFRCTEENLPLIIKAFKRDLVIPEFSSFTEDVESICEKCKGNKRGKVRLTRRHLVHLRRIDRSSIKLSVYPITI